MTIFTRQQGFERLWFQQVMETVTKVEPHQWAGEIHDVLLRLQKQHKDVNSIMDAFDQELHSMTVDTFTGDNLEGWKLKKVYLTGKQKNLVLTWFDFAFRCGMRFSEAADTEKE